MDHQAQLTACCVVIALLVLLVAAVLYAAYCIGEGVKIDAKFLDTVFMQRERHHDQSMRRCSRTFYHAKVDDGDHAGSFIFSPSSISSAEYTPERRREDDPSDVVDRATLDLNMAGAETVTLTGRAADEAWAFCSRELNPRPVTPLSPSDPDDSLTVEAVKDGNVVVSRTFTMNEDGVIALEDRPAYEDWIRLMCRRAGLAMPAVRWLDAEEGGDDAPV